MDLTFEEETHTYRLNGELVPSVTQVIEAAGLKKPYHGDAWYGERGTAVHRAAHLLEDGSLDWDTVDPRITGFLKAYDSFIREAAWKTIFSERRMCCASLGFAGTMDKLGRMRRHDWVVDLKTGGRENWHPVQTSGYEILASHEGLAARGSIRRAALYLREDGTYYFEEHKETRDAQVFRAALITAAWKRQNGVA